METSKLSLWFMPDVCFSGWFHVTYFMIRRRPVFFKFFLSKDYQIFFFLIILDSWL